MWSRDPTSDKSTERKVPVALPYIKGLSKELHRVFKQHGVSTYHKPFNTLRSLLVKPKDKPVKEKKCGTIYRVKCEDCEKEYVGETARTLGKRFKEHTDGNHNSAISEHFENTGHHTSLDSVRILAQEEKWWPRKIKEAIQIHKRRPALNRDQGVEIPPPILLQLVA